MKLFRYRTNDSYFILDDNITMARKIYDTRTYNKPPYKWITLGEYEKENLLCGYQQIKFSDLPKEAHAGLTNFEYLEFKELEYDKII